MVGIQYARGEKQRRRLYEDLLKAAYAVGRGRITVQAKVHVEAMSRNRNRLVITEIPYLTNKTNLIEKIADLARDEKIEGLVDLRDESDFTGMRLVIEVSRLADPGQVLESLLTYTQLRQTFGVTNLALVEEEGEGCARLAAIRSGA